MPTSGSYNFVNFNSDNLITEAYERIGILPDLITAQKIQTAERSANLILAEWGNRGLNQWTVTQAMINLNVGQGSYTLPINLSRVLECTIRTSTRQLGGTAVSVPGGVAQNAFSGNPLLACTQTGPNGYISYNYGAGVQQSITLVGIQSNATLNYTINIEYSNDGINWLLLLFIPSQTYTVGINQWFVLPAPVPAQYFRIREAGGSTLNIQEIFFNNTVNDTAMSVFSRQEYVFQPNKSQQGRPTTFWLDRQTSPILYIWPTPSPQYNNLYYTYVRIIQDLGSLTNLMEIPQWFYEALCAGLAFKLSIKSPQFDPVRTKELKELYQESFDYAAKTDDEQAPFRMFGDYSGGWTYV